MLKDILEQRGLSVYAAAKGSGIPYTTLNELMNGKKNAEDCSIKTIEALALFLNMPMESVMNLLRKNETVVIRQTWQEKRNKKFSFPIIFESKLYDASRIHPLKQKIAADLSENLSKENCIDSLFLFGSSVNIRCNKYSDIDLAIELKNGCIDDQTKNRLSEQIQTICDWKADIIWLDHIKKDSKLYNNVKKGLKLI